MHQAPQKTYYAVIFKSKRRDGDEGFAEMADKTEAEAAKIPGFLSADSVRGADGWGITVSYWESPESIETWQKHLLHREAKARGKSCWFSEYSIRICKVGHESFFRA